MSGENEELRLRLIAAIDRIAEEWCRAFPDGRGGYFERVSGEGSPVPVPYRRLHASARVLYVFSELARTRGEFLKRSRVALRYLDLHWSFEQSLFIYQLDWEKSHLNRSLDAYGHAFVLFAFAKHVEVTGDPTLFRRIFQIDARCEAVFWNGEFYRERISESGESTGSGISQNHHMHFFEAYLELIRVTRDDRFRERATRIYQLAKRFFLVEGRVLELRKGEDDSLESAVVEPGHVYEWAWLLLQYSELFRDQDAKALGETLLFWVDSAGIDTEMGGVFDQVSFSGTPLKNTKRIWPLAEAIRTHSAYSGVGGEKFGTFTRLMLERYLHRERLWWEHLNRDFTPLTDEIPVTTMYHLITCREALAKPETK